jgi:hypothetical protein
MAAITVYKYGEDPRPIQHFDLEEHIKYGWFTEPQTAPAIDADLKSAETPIQTEPKKLKEKI